MEVDDHMDEQVVEGMICVVLGCLYRLYCAVVAGCYKITTVFSHAQTVVLCVGCSTVLCQPTGGKARLTEGECVVVAKAYPLILVSGLCLLSVVGEHTCMCSQVGLKYSTQRYLMQQTLITFCNLSSVSDLNACRM